RAVDGAVRIDERIALVARDLVVQVHLRIGPVPHRHDDVALFALRSRRYGVRELAARDPIGPVGPHAERALAAHLREPRTHAAAAGLSRLNATIPRVGRCLETPERLRDLARGLVPHLVAARAAIRVDHVADPLALTLDGLGDAVALRARAREILRGWQLQQREP